MDISTHNIYNIRTLTDIGWWDVYKRQEHRDRIKISKKKGYDQPVLLPAD